ncbi:hypothetical protein [Streptococcus catagoni]|nr:hypothetical protein [Streptococcus catagoni]
MKDCKLYLIKGKKMEEQMEFFVENSIMVKVKTLKNQEVIMAVTV